MSSENMYYDMYVCNILSIRKIISNSTVITDCTFTHSKVELATTYPTAQRVYNMYINLSYSYVHYYELPY